MNSLSVIMASHSKTILLGTAYCVIVFLLDLLSNIGLYRGFGVLPWTPASGLSLVYAFIYGPASWPFLLIGELLLMNGSSPVQLPLGWRIFLPLLNTACWIAGAESLRRLPRFSSRLRTTRSFGFLFGVAFCIATAMGTVYVTALLLTDIITYEIYYPLAWRASVGHFVGILVVTPLLLVSYFGTRWPKPSVLHLVQLGVVMMAIWIIFNYPHATTYQLFYLLFVPLVWVGLRDGVKGAAVVLNVAQLGIIIGAQVKATVGTGPGELQVLMIALGITGLLVGAVVVEREEAARRLHEQTAALGRTLRLRSAGETAAAIAHQINQPITAISTYASVARLAMERGDEALARATLEKLDAQCIRAAEVMQSVRNLVKQGSLTPQTFRIERLASDLRAGHAAECEDAGIIFDIDIAANATALTADKVQIEQALENLVSNSIEAIRDTGTGGRIEFKAWQEAGNVFLQIEDDGPGFAAGLEDIATTPFMTTKKNGTGLGLAIARSVAEAHGGSLAVNSRGHGASVRLRLPTSGVSHG